MIILAASSGSSIGHADDFGTTLTTVRKSLCPSSFAAKFSGTLTMSINGDCGGCSRDGIAVGVVGGLVQRRPRDSASATSASDWAAAVARRSIAGLATVESSRRSRARSRAAEVESPPMSARHSMDPEEAASTQRMLSACDTILVLALQASSDEPESDWPTVPPSTPSGIDKGPTRTLPGSSSISPCSPLRRAWRSQFC